MGWLDRFFKRTQEPVRDAAPEQVAERIDFTPLVEMAAIITRDDPRVAEDIALLVADPGEFRSRHETWFDEMSYPWPDSPGSEDMLFVFAYWLVGYETPHAYGVYIDWKEAPGDIVWQLRPVLTSLGVAIDVSGERFDESEGDTWSALVRIAQRLEAAGCTLAIIDTMSDCYHLYVVPSASYPRLVALAESVRFRVYVPS